MSYPSIAPKFGSESAREKSPTIFLLKKASAYVIIEMERFLYANQKKEVLT